MIATLNLFFRKQLTWEKILENLHSLKSFLARSFKSEERCTRNHFNKHNCNKPLLWDFLSLFWLLLEKATLSFLSFITSTEVSSLLHQASSMQRWYKSIKINFICFVLVLYSCCLVLYSCCARFASCYIMLYSFCLVLYLCCLVLSCCTLLSCAVVLSHVVSCCYSCSFLD